MTVEAESVAAAAIRDCIASQERLLEEERLRSLVEAARVIVESLSHGGKLLLFGNGGSASAAAHMAAEFVGRFQCERKALPALSLCANDSAITAIANDYGFEYVFVRQLEALGNRGDAAVAISTSGRSANVLAGVTAARGLGLATIGLTGADGGELVAGVDVCLSVPARSTARIQEGHILVAHILCELVERQLGLVAVFLDRDGVINRKAPEGEYVTSWEGFEFLPGVLQGLALLGRSPMRILVVTNQRGIARRRMTEGDLEEIHRRMLGAVAAAGGRIDAIYHCPHEGGCRCRKPEIGMFEDAGFELGFDLSQTAVVGDSSSDMLAAERIGAVRVMVGGGDDVGVDRRVADLLAAARWLTGCP